MLNNLKHTAKHTFIYSIGNISIKIIGLILLPLYTSHLSVNEYGILTILEITNQFLINVLNLRLGSAMMRWWADSKNEKDRKVIVFNTFAPLTLIILAFNLVLQPTDSFCSELFFGNQKYNNYFSLLFIWTALEVINETALSLIRLKEKPGFYAILSILKFTSILGLNVYFIVVLHYGVKGIILSQVIGSALSFFIVLPMILKNIFWKIDIKIFLDMIKYSAPLIFSSIFSLILTLSDRYIIKLLIDYSQVGVYSLGYKLAGVINVFIVRSFQMSFLPIAFKMYKEPNASRFFAKILNYYTFILVLSMLFLSFFAKEVIILFSPNNKDYWLAYSIVPFISLTFVFNGIKFVFALGLHFAKKTKYNAYIVLISALLNIGLNFTLIPLIGIYGAAISSVITGVLASVFFYRISQKHFKIKYEVGKILKIIGLAIILYLCSLLTNYTSIWIGFVIKIALWGSFPFILYYWNFYEKIEILRLKQAWSKWKNPFSWKKHFQEIAKRSKKTSNND